MGSVKEKTVARNLYAQARARGKAAGIVRLDAAFRSEPCGALNFNLLLFQDQLSGHGDV